MRFSMAVVGGVLATSATGQVLDPDPREVILIHVERPVLEPGESTLVTMLAGFDSDTAWCMGLVVTDVMVEGDAVRFDELRLIAPMDHNCLGSPLSPGECSVGTATAFGVEGIVAGQLHLGGSGTGIFGDPTDPLNFWKARLHAPATIVEPMEIRLSTRSTSYIVYRENGSSIREERIDQLVEGQATITIVRCRADFNGDGVADLFDFLAFFNAFDAGDALADFDFDGELTVFDFLAFQNRFDLGC